MNIHDACQVLESLSEKEVNTINGKLSYKEFHAIQMVLLEIQTSKKHNTTMDVKQKREIIQYYNECVRSYEKQLCMRNESEKNINLGSLRAVEKVMGILEEKF